MNNYNLQQDYSSSLEPVRFPTVGLRRVCYRHPDGSAPPR
jgi:hypothetical protein